MHLLGGTIGLLGTCFLKPRLGYVSNYDQSVGMGYAIKVCREQNINVRMAEIEYEQILLEFEALAGRKSEYQL